MSHSPRAEPAPAEFRSRTIARPDRCPECGWATDDRTPAPRPGVLLRVIIPWTTLGLALIVLAVWLVRTSETNSIGSGSHSLRYAIPAVTFADVKAAAAGTSLSTNPSFYDAVVRGHQPPWGSAPGERQLYAGYSMSGGLLEERFTFGWPLTWFNDWRWSMFADAARRRDPIAIVSDPTQIGIGPNTSITPDAKFATRPRWSWNMNMISFRPPPEETGGVSVWKDLQVLSIVATIGLAVAIGSIVHIVMAILLRVTRRTARSFPARRAGVLASVASLLAMIVVAFATAERVELARLPSAGPQRTLGRPASDGLNTQSPVGIGESQLQALREAPDRDQQLARAILAATNPSLRNDDALLLTELIPASQIAMPQSTSTSFNRAVGLFSISDMQYHQRPSLQHDPMGPHPTRLPTTELARMTLPEGWKLGLTYGSISLTLSTGNPDDFIRAYSISLLWLGTIAAACLLLWLIMRIPCMFLIWRMRRWRRSNRCAACGHALGPAPVRA